MHEGNQGFEIQILVSIDATGGNIPLAVHLGDVGLCEVALSAIEVLSDTLDWDTHIRQRRCQGMTRRVALVLGLEALVHVIQRPGDELLLDSLTLES